MATTKNRALCTQDNLAALEIDAALQANGPELMNGLLQRHRLAMLFRLWDPQGRGGVSRLALAAVLEFYYRRPFQLQRAPHCHALPLLCNCHHLCLAWEADLHSEAERVMQDVSRFTPLSSMPA